MLTLYGFGQSRSFRCLWALEESGLDFNYKALDMRAGESQSEHYKAIHPEGKVPAIDDDGFVLTESGAILNYIAGRSSNPQFKPADGTKDRALYDQTFFFILTELEQPLWTTGKHKFALPKEQRCPDVLETARWEFSKALNTLQLRLANHAHVVGDLFTYADIMVAHTLNWAIRFEFPLEDENLLAYRERMYQRPACLRAMARLD